jgi:hypothetical protein
MKGHIWDKSAVHNRLRRVTPNICTAEFFKMLARQRSSVAEVTCLFLTAECIDSSKLNQILRISIYASWCHDNRDGRISSCFRYEKTLGDLV